jgi:xylulokinase
MVGCGVYNDVRSAADALVSVCSTVQPDEALVELYNERYSKFRQIYPAMKNLFAELA